MLGMIGRLLAARRRSAGLRGTNDPVGLGISMELVALGRILHRRIQIGGLIGFVGLFTSP